MTKQIHFRHGGDHSHELYKIYYGMLQRCTNPNAPNYEKYGGRGIRVCDRWYGENGFTNFASDMGTRPSPSHTLDRVNNDGNYEPGNCRWGTKTIQSLNRNLCAKNESGVAGVWWDKTRSRWLAHVRVSGRSINLGRYAHKEDAIKARKEGETKYYLPLLKEPT